MAYQGYLRDYSDSSYVLVTMSNFVGIYDLSNIPTTQWAFIDSDGGNLYVTDSTDTEYPFYVFNIDTVAETGWIIFKMPTISSSSNTEIRIHIDDSSRNVPAVTATYGRNNVFTDYVAAFLFQEASGNTIDLTGNGNNITWTGGPTYQQTGQFGYCIELTNPALGQNAATDYGTITHDSSLTMATTGDMFFETVVKNNDDYVNSFPDLSCIFEKGNTSNAYSMLFRGGTPARNGFYCRTISSSTSYEQDSDTDVRTTLNDNTTFKHCCMSYDHSATTLDIYFNGNNEGSRSIGTPGTETDTMLIGCVVGGTRYYSFDGFYQLFFIRSTTLTDNEVETYYNNRIDTANFWAGATWVSSGGGGATFKPKSTIVN